MIDNTRSKCITKHIDHSSDTITATKNNEIELYLSHTTAE